MSGDYIRAPADEDWDAANRAELARLNAMPWRGACPLCIDRLWCADTEDQARRLVGEHIAAEHDPSPRVWRDHDDPETAGILGEAGATAEAERGEVVRGVAAARKPRPADTRMAIDPDGNVKPVSEFAAEEKWWCDGEDCGEDLGYPHVHTYTTGARAVDLLTGREIKPDATADAALSAIDIGDGPWGVRDPAAGPETTAEGRP